MKKKIFVGIIIFLAVFIASTLVLALGPREDIKPSEYNLGTTYEIAMKEKKPFIMMFYSDWCSSCIKFARKYKLIEEIYKDKYNVVMVNVDEEENLKILQDYWPSGIPNVFIVDPTIDNRIHINGALYGDLGKLREEFDRYLRIRAMIKP